MALLTPGSSLFRLHPHIQDRAEGWMDEDFLSWLWVGRSLPSTITHERAHPLSRCSRTCNSSSEGGSNGAGLGAKPPAARLAPGLGQLHKWHWGPWEWSQCSHCAYGRGSRGWLGVLSGWARREHGGKGESWLQSQGKNRDLECCLRPGEGSSHPTDLGKTSFSPL